MKNYILYRGPSAFDGSPIVAIIAKSKTNNSKNKATKGKKKQTDLAQLYILPDTPEKTPYQHVKTQTTRSICGDCPHQQVGACYTHATVVPKAAGSMHRALARGSYGGVISNLAQYKETMNGRELRSAAWGDSAAIPRHVWIQIQLWDRAINNDPKEKRGRGYTHAWRDADHLRDTHMASVETLEDVKDAIRLGWRYFRVRKADQPLLDNETVCPASNEAGNLTTCATCNLCTGTQRSRAPNIAIIDHGPNSRKKAA